MNGTICPSGSARCTPLTTPADTLFSKPNGEPIAITHSPRLTRGLRGEVERRQVLRVDLDERDVGALVAADDLGGEFAAVGELHDDFGRAVDDVRVGDDVAVGAHDEARAQAARRLLRAHARAVRHAAEALEEFVVRAVFVDVLEVLPALALRVERADVDDGRSGAIDQRGEVGKVGRRGGGRHRGAATAAGWVAAWAAPTGRHRGACSPSQDRRRCRRRSRQR